MVVLKDAMASFDNPSFVLSKNEDVHKKHVPSTLENHRKDHQKPNLVRWDETVKNSVSPSRLNNIPDIP